MMLLRVSFVRSPLLLAVIFMSSRLVGGWSITVPCLGLLRVFRPPQSATLQLPTGPDVATRTGRERAAARTAFAEVLDCIRLATVAYAILEHCAGACGDFEKQVQGAQSATVDAPTQIWAWP